MRSTMTQDPQHVDIVPAGPTDPLSTWEPVVGPETNALVDKALADDMTRAQVLTQTRKILARCVDPSAPTPQPRTGLVVGYVQSGKTLSFTALTAMARDNGFALVVLLAGTKISLHDQTAARLIDDLRVEREGMSPWYLLSNPEATSAQANTLATKIKTMLNPAAPEMFRQTTVITVMKNTNRIDKVRDLLAMLGSHGVPIETLPVLVIDDEADQAGMNAARVVDGVKGETPTYSSILSLRDAAPKSSYVMYTATPQAPLLINLADALSPDHVNVLTPGPGYTGGKYFFDERRASFVHVMSDAEVSGALDAGALEPPESLKSAFATFYLAKTMLPPERMISMLVHPSHGTELHSLYGQFVTALRSQWADLLATPSIDRDELVATYFKPAYDDLVSSTERDVPPLDELMASIHWWMGATEVRVINSNAANAGDLNWATAPTWIVIGGNKLDRGFTIEGLAVTYMPRGIGIGNADTIQQRARFFGYKAAYGDLCRAWLPASLADSYEHYVEHEEHLRAELGKAEQEGTPLKDWTRKMLLDPLFKATRRAVIDIPFLHGRFKPDAWTAVDRIGKLGAGAAANRERLDGFLLHRAAVKVVDERDPRPTKHTVFSVSLSELLEELLVDWKGDLGDRVLLQQLCLVLKARADDDPDLMADVYLMDDLKSRARSLTSDCRSVSNLQQGRAPKGPYEGDKVFFTQDRFSLQVHDVRGRDGDPCGTSWKGIGLTFRLPKELAGGALVQLDDEL
ncbi:Z1 domain-containing protein [Aeromicrobium sp. CnD17-E]|uniref:Z1 domain-containing protein n=1 Tax=Aeromicrobium sp. CnD17-E TaxID=2954487 RepID=UPI002097505C|nr:Z1 domain-containing protein [Aeromicrobium sp. CnD17-E]MCO7237920.1 Z1 domain-containing protein [Aeromicrobium sp. CnD17-E]